MPESEAKELRGKLGKAAYLEDWITKITSLTASDSTFNVTFDWDEEIGIPGAFIIKNYHHSEFYLKTLTLEDVPGHDISDLGNDRPILGGSTKYPYPRRGRTGRPPAEKDPRYESRLPLLKSTNIYVPRDEKFSHLKMSDVIAYGLRSVFQFLLPEFEAQFDKTPSEFDKLDDILELYEGGIKLPNSHLLESIRREIPSETLRELLRSDGQGTFKFPTPQVIKEDKSAWRTDEEFATEMLAGVNPIVIRCLKEFPPKSKLDPEIYGKQISSITEEHINNNLEGLTIDEAIKNNTLFILDYHDTLMPYLRRINRTSTQIYATRTLLFLKNDCTLKPLAIELSLPLSETDRFRVVSKVCTPAQHGIEGTIWLLAKAYVAVNDSGYHQLICHWLNTHAAIEPFVIATNRQLNYVEDSNSPHGLRLLIEDYPDAVDGLEFWSAIKTWVEHYCCFYYKSDDMVQNDSELQSWWKELQEKGHGDKKDEPWWPEMQTRKELIDSCTIIIWVASALQAAVNFRQYPYGSYLPNPLAMSRRLIPEPDSPDYDELNNREEIFLKTITAQLQSIIGISLIEILSMHSADEVFLGQRDTPQWTADSKPLEAFKEFGEKLEEIEERIERMNKDKN
ncbi:hypothetical protein F0562_029352 [Nyssa sinensis]|uniref:Lipoxygenase domain-containing protein n=1 Tax=Nyssa sinensis TaxID=561372 RepID=A0A5J5B2R7_9ASTE|nr:hypothetical protein F0562_029352 [Nyssa sinensis]